MDEKLKQFLKIMQMLESSGGKNLDHPPAQVGVNAGDTAVGSYAIMPNTAKELINRRRLQGDVDPELQQLRQMDNEQVSAYLNERPEVQEQLAQQLGQKVLDQYGGDEEKAAYAWQYGHNIPSQKMDTIPYKENERVQKYNALRKLSGEQ